MSHLNGEQQAVVGGWPVRTTGSAGSRAEPLTTGRRAELEGWLEARVAGSRAMVSEFTLRRGTEHLTPPETAVLGRIATDFVARGKFLRSTFAYLGWMCGRPESAGAAQAAASLELLHAFALIQDDVMDDSATRRGRPTVHVQLADWARRTGGVADADRFGRSGAVLLADLCLVWAERMLREADLPAASLGRAWPVFDVLRCELAVGQFQDLLNEGVDDVTPAAVLEIARRKSGNYSVRRPLELGAALAGCPPRVVEALRRYGTLIGEAFQLRDDVLGVFGDPAVTGKPVGDDLRQRKATTLVVAARELADEAQGRQLRRLAALRPAPGPEQETWVRQWQQLIRATGAPQWAEQAISSRRADAQRAIESVPQLPPLARQALLLLADRCARRDQ